MTEGGSREASLILFDPGSYPTSVDLSFSSVQLSSAAMELAKEAPNMMPDILPTILIPSSAVLAIIFGLWLWKRVSAISLVPGGPCRPSAARSWSVLL